MKITVNDMNRTLLYNTFQSFHKTYCKKYRDMSTFHLCLDADGGGLLLKETLPTLANERLMDFLTLRDRTRIEFVFETYAEGLRLLQEYSKKVLHGASC